MNSNTTWRSHLLAVMMTAVMILSGFSCFAFAEDGDSDQIVYNNLTLGSKKNIVFNDLHNKYYKVKVSKKGLYKLSIYSTYHNDSNNDFWVGLYSSASDAESMNNLIDNETGLVNYDNSATDYELFNLDAGTYYMVVEAFHENNNKLGLKFAKATDNDLWTLSTYDPLYAGMKDQYISVMYDNPATGKSAEGTITSVVSKNRKVAKITSFTAYDQNNKKIKVFRMNLLKPGKSKLVVKYKRTDGKSYTISKTITVKKYPAPLKSVKVNGSSVSISKNKYGYTKDSYKKTAAKVQLKLKSGWKVSGVYVNYYNFDNGAYSGKDVSKSKITGGKQISFPKKYHEMHLDISLENSRTGEFMPYSVYFYRNNM